MDFQTMKVVEIKDKKDIKANGFSLNSPHNIPPGLKIYINPIKCINCGLCAQVCPFGLPIQDAIGKYFIEKVNECVECSACQRNCPTNAIIMQEQKGCGCLWNVVSERHGKKTCCN